MSPLNTSTKLQDFIDKYVACEYENLRAQIVDGELREVEDVVHAFALNCFDVLMEDLMGAAAKQIEQEHREHYNNLETRPQTIQVRSGTKISVNGCYTQNEIVWDFVSVVLFTLLIGEKPRRNPDYAYFFRLD